MIMKNQNERNLLVYESKAAKKPKLCLHILCHYTHYEIRFSTQMLCTISIIYMYWKCLESEENMLKRKDNIW